MKQPDPLAVEIVARFVDLIHAWQHNRFTEAADARDCLARLGVNVRLPRPTSAIAEERDRREALK